MSFLKNEILSPRKTSKLIISACVWRGNCMRIYLINFSHVADPSFKLMAYDAVIKVVIAMIADWMPFILGLFSLFVLLVIKWQLIAAFIAKFCHFWKGFLSNIAIFRRLFCRTLPFSEDFFVEHLRFLNEILSNILNFLQFVYAFINNYFLKLWMNKII